MTFQPTSVMAGLDPAIHEEPTLTVRLRVDTRLKLVLGPREARTRGAGHDEE